jgi:uncharacterized protein (DUF433 family)
MRKQALLKCGARHVAGSRQTGSLNCGWSARSKAADRRRVKAAHVIMETGVSEMLDWTTCMAVERNPQKLCGAWVFRGTRVPVSALFANIEGGATVDEFIEWFPGVSREQVKLVLEHASRSLAQPVPA